MLTDQKIGRERILAGASALLDSGRYTDLTVDALARFLRMSKSTLYKFFASKEDVLIALVADACERADAELFVSMDNRSPSILLTELAVLLGRHGQRLPRAVLLEPEQLPPACKSRVARTLEAYGLAAAEVVQRGVEMGEFHCPDPRLAGIAFVSAAGAAVADGARHGISDYGAQVAIVPLLLLHGLTRRESAR